MSTYRSRMMTCSLIDWTDHVSQKRVDPGQLLPSLRKAAEEFPGTTDRDLEEAAWFALKAIAECEPYGFAEDYAEAEELYVRICSGL